ncbi:MAG: hypothetical protein EOS21_32430 [Mesorhizobium sp.]|nr:MAG: hypothetical protein EOS21_32430 [Mesorhizobium sp.]
MRIHYLALFLPIFGHCIIHPDIAVSADARPVIRSQPPKKAAKIVEKAQYAFEVRCTAKSELQDPSNFFTAKNRSLFVLVAPQAPAATDKLPPDVLAAVQVYSIGRDATTRQPIVVDDRDCKKDFLVNGSKQTAIVITDNQIDNFSDAAFGQVLSNAFSLVSPLFSILTGDALPALVAGKVASAGNVQTAVQNILTALGRGRNLTVAVRNLRVGTYVVATKYASVSISIRPVVSIVTDRNPAFKDDLRAQINAANVKLDAAKIESSCRAARYDIFSLGFRSPLDLAYGLTSLAAHAGFNKKEMLTCLGPEYAAVAVAADARFWQTFPNGVQLRPSDIPAPSNEEEQPTWAKAQPIINQLVVRLAQYTRNDPPPQPAIDGLAKALASSVSIIDDSTTFAIGQTGNPVDRFEAIKQFKSKGYIKFGCYTATDDATGLGVDGLTSMFLVFKAANDVTKVPIDSALVVRPRFLKGTIGALTVSDNRAWVTATLKARDYDCNGFSVDRPPSTQQPK